MEKKLNGLGLVQNFVFCLGLAGLRQKFQLPFRAGPGSDRNFNSSFGPGPGRNFYIYFGPEKSCPLQSSKDHHEGNSTYSLRSLVRQLDLKPTTNQPTNQPCMVEEVFVWGQILETKILNDLHFLRSPTLENHIFSDLSVRVRVYLFST